VRWLILSRSGNSFVDSLAERIRTEGYHVKLQHKDELIDRSVPENDVVVLKSRLIPFLYAGFRAQLAGKVVIPDPLTAYRLRNRWEAELYLREMGIRTPPAVMGFWRSLKKELDASFFPAVRKPLMGSKNMGIELVGSPEELERVSENELLYLQKYVEGEHFQIDFIANEIYMRPKKPLHFAALGGPISKVPSDIGKMVRRYRDHIGSPIGDMDVVVGDELWVVDPGLFPRFEYLEDAGMIVGSLLIREVERRIS